MSLGALHAATGFPKPSIVRLLERLIADRVVARVSKPGCYRLTAELAELGRGFEPSWIAVDAVVRQPELLSGYKWPVAIGTRDGASLLVLFSNRRPDSPYSFRPSTVGTRLPLLTTAMGTAYLTYCDDGERERAAQDLGVAGSGSGWAADEIAKVTESTRARGYGLRLGGRGESTTVALPILNEAGALYGVIAQSAFAAATTATDIKTSARELRATALLLQQYIRSFHAQPPPV